MKRKLIAAILAVCTLSVPQVLYAEEYVDYSDEISELENLIESCEEKGFSVEYEKVNYSVLKMFEKYLNEDLDNGVSTDSERWIYNVSVMDGLYADTKDKLIAYLDGDDSPLVGKLPDMTDTVTRGTSIYSGGKPVFSIGFGHTSEAMRDVGLFNTIGCNNIQLEMGPDRMVYSLGGWKNGSTSDDYTISLSTLFKKEGNSALKIKNNSTENFARIYQSIAYKDGVTYEFGFWGTTNGSEPGTLFVSASDWAPDLIVQTSTSWQEYSSTYTHNSNENPNCEFAILYRKNTGRNATAYLDGFYLYELDAEGNRVSDNLLKNSGFETDWGYDDCISYITNALKTAEAKVWHGSSDMQRKPGPHI